MAKPRLKGTARFTVEDTALVIVDNSGFVDASSSRFGPGVYDLVFDQEHLPSDTDVITIAPENDDPFATAYERVNATTWRVRLATFAEQPSNTDSDFAVTYAGIDIG